MVINGGAVQSRGGAGIQALTMDINGGEGITEGKEHGIFSEFLAINNGILMASGPDDAFAGRIKNEIPGTG